MKNQAIFHRKIKEKILKCHLLQYMLGALRGNNSKPRGQAVHSL